MTAPTATNPSPIPTGATVRRIRFVAKPGVGQEVIASFVDPEPHVAVLASDGDGIEILSLPGLPNEQLGWSDGPMNWVLGATAPGAPQPVAITIHGAQVIWSPTRAAVLAPPDRMDSLSEALLDFCYHERALARIEAEIAENWPSLHADVPLAHAVTARDRDRFEDVGSLTGGALRRRIRLARIVPHLNRPRPHFSPLANQMVDRLREKAHTEERIEALGLQFDAYERVYEMASQRIADYTSARQSHTLELIIIVILAAETLLLLLDLLRAKGL